MKTSHPRITVIGGGTGSYTLLSALKSYTPNITALVNMADDGGSTGVLRDELGVLPPGDVRQCLIALSDAPQELRDLFNFRFPSGSLEGHSFGNIFLSAVEKMTSSFEEAVRMAGDVLRIKGGVRPITLDDCQLIMESGGKKIRGQRAIELANLPPHSHPNLSFKAPARATKAALQAILDTDLVIIAPGNLYASLAPALIVDDIAEALATTKAQVVFVCNLVNKPNHTADFAVHEYVAEVERLTAPGIIQTVLYNIDTPTQDLLERYALENEYPVVIDKKALADAPYEAIAGNFLSHHDLKRNPSDIFINRSLIRHDAAAVLEVIKNL